MSTIYWIGKADAVAQQTTATPGGTIAAETFTLTVGGASVAYTATGGDTATQVAEGLRDAWNNAPHPYFTAVTATADAGVVTLTADEAGVPFVITGDASGAATLGVSNSVGNSGPHDWSTAANWSGGNVPANSDIVIIENSNVPVLWGLDQSSVTLTELRLGQSYTGRIGLPDDAFTTDVDAIDASKPEYRDAYLRIGATTVRIGEHHGPGNPAGASRIKLDTGAAQTELNIANSAVNPADVNLEPICWIGSHASNVVNVTRGRVGIATNLPGETATVSELNIGQRGNVAHDADVHVGDGAAITTIHQAGGELMLAADATTIAQSAGTIITIAGAAVTTLDVAGNAYLNSDGTITTLRVAGSGSADFSHDPRPRTVTNCQVHKGATLNIDNGNALSVTFTHGIEFARCEPRDTTLVLGPHVKVGLSAI
jgi:hypothetical protein